MKKFISEYKALRTKSEPETSKDRYVKQYFHQSVVGVLVLRITLERTV